MKKKLFSIFIIFSFFCVKVFSAPDIGEYVLENGMHVFILEDFSSPLVRLEYSARAGFSSQTPGDAGFFPLYSRLFKYSSPDNIEILSSLESECNADSSRYVINVATSDFIPSIAALSQAAFNPVFSNQDLERELKILKKEVTDNAFSIEGFINSSIDSRIYSKTPWKHDSGIYPAFFSKSSNSTSRLILSNISKNFYTPKNSVLFISGPVTKDFALKVSERYFGSFTSVSKTAFQQKEVESDVQSKKLFVLSDPEFSPDMIQVVMQYTSLNMEQADCAAAVFNQDNSLLKQTLISKSVLKIRAPSYINIASAHKNNSSRLVIQSLLENPRVSPYNAGNEFVLTVKDLITKASEQEFSEAKELLKTSFYNSVFNSSEVMNLLSQYWAVEGQEEDYEVSSEQTLVEKLFQRTENIEVQDFSDIKQKLLDEDPYVFILVNSKVLSKYQKTFEANGYEIVTAKNGSWYTQELYKNFKKNLETASEDKSEQLELSTPDLFAEKNYQQFSSFKLINDIPVYIKEKPVTNSVCFSVVIDGGELINSKNEYGLEAVMADCLSLLVQNACYKKFADGEIRNYPSVQAETGLKNSIITVECLYEDLPHIVDAFADSLIFSEVIPAMVDSVVMQQKSNQIVKTSSPVFQLYSNGIGLLFKDKGLLNASTLNQDILKNVTYARILEDYPKLLNADRYKIIVAGNVNGAYDNDLMTLKNQLDSSFGVLTQNGKIENSDFEMAKNPKKVKKVKLVHLFLTDVSKEKAGPRPQVLIPTTEFLDPAQFWIQKDSLISTEQFNAVLFSIADEVEKACSGFEQKQKVIVKVDPATENIPYGIITFLSVNTVSSVENAYKEVVEKISQQLSDEYIQQSKNLWVRNSLSLAETNRGICLLINAYLDKEEKSFENYVKYYETVKSLDENKFKEILETFDFERVFRLFSVDTKK